MEELLRIENISYQYDNSHAALKNVSATFYQGERIAVLGNNGAGKSTFFLCCNGVLCPKNGKIFLNNIEITRSKKDMMSLRQKVGLVFQEPDSQIIAGTVENEVSFGPMNLHLDYSEVELRVAQSLGQMNLDGYRSRAPQYLSGGEKKRVSVADILAMQPCIVLLDEPTASLDPENVALLERTLDDLSLAGITLVVSTHDVDFAYSFASRAIVFSQGEIIADADIGEVFASEHVLAKAGLKKPMLYSVAELLENRFPESAPGKMPRNLEELRRYMENL